MGDLQQMVNVVQAGLPTWLRCPRLGISLILFWLRIAQFVLITQGWGLIGRSGKPAE